MMVHELSMQGWNGISQVTVKMFTKVKLNLI